MGKKLFYGAIFLVVVIGGFLLLSLPKPGKTGQFEWAMNVGKNYLDQGEAAKAVGVFEKAVETNPTHPDGRLNLANALLLNDQPDLALGQAREASLLDRNSAAAYFVQGCALNRLRRFEEAVQPFFLSINLDSSVAATHFQLGRAHLELGQFEESIRDFEEVIRLEPEHASAHYQLSQALVRLDRQPESVEQLALHQKIVAKLPQQSVSAATFERSKHTAARVPFTLEQPNPRGISVKFTDATAEMLGSDAAKFSGPAGVIDFNHDGRPSLFVREGDGFRLLANTGGVLRAQGALLPGVAGAGYRRCLVGDLNNDHFDDVVILGEKASHAFRFATNGVATEVTALAGLKEINLTAIDGALSDLDGVGKLDLLVVTTNHSLQVLRNLGNSYFKDITAESGAPGSLVDVEQIVIDDWDNDDTADVLAARSGSMPLLLTKVRGGLLTITNAPTDWPAGSVMAVGDLNNDLRNDLVVAGKSGMTCVLGHLNQRLFIPTGDRPISRIYLVDFDNDGWLDIVTCGIGVRLWRNCGTAGFQEYTVAAGLDKWGNIAVDSIVFADFDNDCDTDFIFCLERGGLIFARNDGGNANHQLKVRLAGNRSNASGIGVRLSASAGGLRLSRTVTQVPMEIGLGRYTQADSLTVRWRDLLLSSIDVKACPALATLVELQVPTGSCPYLYAWDGTQFRFITDILCAAPLGLPLSESRLIEADPDEYFWIGGEAQFPPHDGHYQLKIAEELREVLYLDQAKLVVVDHPAGTVVVSTSKLLPGKPFPPHELVALESPQLIQRAVRSDGLDVTSELRQADRKFVSPVRLRIPQLRGLAEPYSVEMNFGPLDTTKPLVLALTGWLRFGGGMANMAASHNPDLPYPFPTLEAETGDGRWQPVKVEVGAPAGKTKTIMVDLAGRLPAGTRRLKLSTAFEIHWDAAVMYQRCQMSLIKKYELHASSADLQWRGFSDYQDLPWTQPLSPVHDQVQQTTKWSITPSGWCTRYGDVRELVANKDEALVLLNGGDAVTLSYAAVDLPEKPAGMVRDFFLFASGWDKDSDVHVRHGQTVGPLPFHGMDDQRYGMEPRPAFANDVWMKKYNTRWVGPQTLSRTSR